MNRIKLKKGGCRRRKAFLGADGAIQAAATLAAAAMTTGATLASSAQQAKAVKESAATQAKSIEAQNTNNNALQQESIAFTRAQNAENRQQQQDIQTTLQMLAGQQNLNERMEANKAVAKYGKRRVLEKSGMMQPSYGGASPFQITDGGGAVALQTDNNGFGLYELFGNDHEHYHKTRGGKYKSGVGVKLPTGEVVEGEGNQNTNSGELLYVTPNDAIFLSKHSINGFNPAKAVKQGLHPEEAYIAQETLKEMSGLNDDGTRKGKSKKKLNGGHNILANAANLTQSPFNSILPTAGGVVYLVNRDKTSTPVAKCGTRRSLKLDGKRRKAKKGTGNILGINTSGFTEQDYEDLYNNIFVHHSNYGYDSMDDVPKIYDLFPNYNPIAAPAEYSTDTNINTNSFPGDYNMLNELEVEGKNALKKQPPKLTDSKPEGYSPQKSSNNWSRGALYSAIGNLGGAALTTVGNMVAAHNLGKAYQAAGRTLADAYSRLQTIDPNIVKRDDYAAAHAMAAIRDTNYRNTAMRERVRRDTEAGINEMNRNTLSSAARLARTAASNNRKVQSLNEIAEQELQAREQVRQGNMDRINQVSQFNAQQDTQALRDYTSARIDVAKYNNDIENTKITGAAQATADALTQSSSANAIGLQSSANTIGQALINSGNAFATAYNLNRKYENEFLNNYAGLGDRDKLTVALTRADKDKDFSYVNAIWQDLQSRKGSDKWSIDDENALNIINNWWKNKNRT